MRRETRAAASNMTVATIRPLDSHQAAQSRFLINPASPTKHQKHPVVIGHSSLHSVPLRQNTNFPATQFVRSATKHTNTAWHPWLLSPHLRSVTRLVRYGCVVSGLHPWDCRNGNWLFACITSWYASPTLAPPTPCL